MRNKIKTKALQIPTPQNIGELGDLLLKFGEATRRIKCAEADMNNFISETKEAFKQETQTDADFIKQAAKSIQAFAEANRRDLTGDKQHYDAGSAFIRWRLRPASVSISKAEVVIKHLQELGGDYLQFLRVIHEIDKDNILKNKVLAENIDGITIKSEGENFSIELKDEEIPHA